MRRRWTWALTAASVAAASGITSAVEAGTGPAGAYVVTLAPGSDLDLDGTPIGPRDTAVELTAAEAARLAADPAVVAVEPDEPAAAAALPLEPCLVGVSCPAATDQRGLRRIGAASAWEVVTGAPRVVVALVDAGVDTSHPELAGRVTSVRGCAGLDPSFAGGDRTATGHATRVAGIIAAAADGRGIAGVAWGGVVVRSYAALGPDLRGSTAAVAAAVHCAIDGGADIVNLSLTAGDTTAMRNALDRAAAAGVLVVAAAGNGGNGAHPGVYPAAHPSVLAVTAVGDGAGDERRTSGANGGPWVDLAAPGFQVVSTAPGGGVSVADGTSFAAPFVTGAAALVLASNPTLDAAGVRAVLELTAEPLADPTVGRGLVDVAAAVRVPGPGAAPCPAPPASWVLDADGALRPVGGAPDVGQTPRWPGRDLGRDVVTVAGRPGGYVLDAFGALHAFGGAPPLASPAFRPGWDIARGAARRTDGSVVIVDGLGGLHLAGGGVPLGPGGPWWPHTDVARDVASEPTNASVAYVLDAYGGVHVAGLGPNPPAVTVGRYTLGRDLARRIVVLPEGRRGYVLDAAGRLHPWAVAGTALPPPLSVSSGLGAGRGAVVDAAGRVSALTASGAVVPAGGQPCRPAVPFPGRDLARGVALA